VSADDYRAPRIRGWWIVIALIVIAGTIAWVLWSAAHPD
jgi:hypothetical protein